MKIDDYKFGKMVIDGRAFTKDLIIIPDGIVENWWRKEGHRLFVADLAQHIDMENLAELIVGTGRFGMMKVADEVSDFCREHGVRLIVSSTPKAVKEYNKSTEQTRTAAAFHLTC